METTQLVFLLYLVLGQGVLLGSWWPFRPRSPVDAGAPPAPRRLQQIGFALYLLLGQVALFAGWVKLEALWESSGAVARADVVTILHFGFVAFVLGLLLLILVGWPLRWKWTRNFWLRLLHLMCIEIVVGQGLVGLECPLTSLERDLRGIVRPADYGDSKILHYLEGASPVAVFCHNAVLQEIPDRNIPYVVGPFGLFVLLTWLFVPPRMPGQAGAKKDAGSS